VPIISGSGSSSGTAVTVKRYLNKPASGITRTGGTIGAFSTPWQITGVVVASGQNVLLTADIAMSTSASNDYILCFLRGATQIATHNQNTQANVTSRSIMWIDENPGAGTYTYEIQAAMFTAGTITVYQTNPTTDVSGGTSIFVAEVYNP